MLEKILEIDRAVFLWLNNLGTETFDPIWLVITRFTSWIPVFAVFLYLSFKRLGWKHALLLIGCLAVLITITDQATNLFKFYFERLRPVNAPELDGLMRKVQIRQSFSFISGHASNSMAAAYFLYRVLHPYIKWMGLFFLFPLIFAYSRIYLGLHYPGDILCGYAFGILTATLVLRLYVFLRDKYFPEQENLDHPANSEPVTNG